MSAAKTVTRTKTIPSGPAVAAMISAGLGCLAIGVFTTGAVLSEELKNTLNIYNPAGPLSGKTTFAVVIWLVSWLLLGYLWKDKELNLRRSFIITMIMVAVGLLLTFPPFFEAFEA